MSTFTQPARFAGCVLLLTGWCALAGCERGAPAGGTRDGSVDAATNSDVAIIPDASTDLDSGAHSDGAGSDAATGSDAAPIPDAAHPTDAGPGPDAGPLYCSDNGDCNITEFCEKASCDAPTGSCMLRPLTCTDVQAPVCDCDGVTFWNDCLRRQQGQLSAHTGECGNSGLTCGGIANLQCPSSYQNVACAMLYANAGMCAMMDPAGVCWVLPPQCPAIVIGGNLRPCSNPSTGPCLATCEAIRNDATYFRDNLCPM